MRTPADLQEYIAQFAPNATLITTVDETPTVPAAATALGVAPDQIIKTLLFSIDRGDCAELIVVISNGERRVDRTVLAAEFGVGHKRVTLARPAVVADQLDYPVGGVPPFGHRIRLPVLLDASVLRAAEQFGGILYGGGGDDHTMMRLTLEDVLRLCEPRVAALSAAA